MNVTNPMLVLALACATADSTAQSEEYVGSARYVRLETREATRDAVLEALGQGGVTWGRGAMITPFPYAGHDTGDLATPHAPERELALMTAGGPGPDLTLSHFGKNGAEATWRELGEFVDIPIDLHVGDDPEWQDEATAYVYGTVTAAQDTALPVTMGSDDGLRFWLNGELLVDADVDRGLDPEAHALTLELKAGVNHMLAKITEGQGGWQFQINSRDPLDPLTDTQLHYFLDRDFPPNEERRHYHVFSLPVPDDVVLEVGGLAFLPDGRPLAATRRGDVWLVDGAYAEPPFAATFAHFARGLHEPLGLAVMSRDGQPSVYTVQRSELTRLTDVDGDDVADWYDTVTDGWGLSGNYHEFAFGPKIDKDGNFWVTLNVGFCGGLGKSTVIWRGWALKITPDGEITPVCDGLRSPNGIGDLPNGEMFYVDNQGDYVATSRLSHLAPNSWHGHPASLHWRDDVDLEADERPARMPASVWFPYRKMGQSTADIARDDTGGRFGPFEGQLFVGDQTLATVMRVSLEQVNGHYQGACYPFLEDLDCGVNRVAFAPDGSMFVGQTDRGWASVGRKRYGMQRIAYNGTLPFEIHTMAARSDGFELTFTDDVDPASASDPSSYRMTSYTYEYHADYGAPEDATEDVEIESVELTSPRSVRLRVGDLRAPNFVYELHAEGVRHATSDRGLLHPEAYYTLIEVPGSP